MEVDFDKLRHTSNHHHNDLDNDDLQFVDEVITVILSDKLVPVFDGRLKYVHH